MCFNLYYLEAHLLLFWIVLMYIFFWINATLLKVLMTHFIV